MSEFTNNNLYCNNCGNNDKESITVTDIPDQDIRLYTCDLCFSNIRKVSLRDILENQGKGGIKK